MAPSVCKTFTDAPDKTSVSNFRGVIFDLAGLLKFQAKYKWIPRCVPSSESKVLVFAKCATELERANKVMHNVSKTFGAKFE